MKTELIYSLKPIYANLILNKQKNQEFRSVNSISAPESKLMYVADVGDILNINEEEFAYPIIHFYEIKKPIS